MSHQVIQATVQQTASLLAPDRVVLTVEEVAAILSANAEASTPPLPRLRHLGRGIYEAAWDIPEGEDELRTLAGRIVALASHPRVRSVSRLRFPQDMSNVVATAFCVVL